MLPLEGIQARAGIFFNIFQVVIKSRTIDRRKDTYLAYILHINVMDKRSLSNYLHLVRINTEMINQ